MEKKRVREERRRREARENGVVLEKVGKTGTGKRERRERSVGGPSVGKFRGGTLKLGRKDLESIQGRGSGGGRGGKGGKSGGGEGGRGRGL